MKHTTNYVQITVLAVVGFFLLLSIPGWVSASDGTILLQATGKHPEASGTAVIVEKHVNVQARGLRPDAVYTVWFVNTKPEKHETGAGKAPYKFTTDSRGNGNYSSDLAESPFDKWAMVMVVLHPDGNPANMKNMVGAFSARL